MSIHSLARPEIRALKPYASARSLADSTGLLLNANENPWAPSVNGAGNGSALNRYPDPQPAALKAALAGEYGVRADQLLITRGSDEGIDLLVRTFCRPGTDKVLICPPCFGMYALSAHVQGASVIEVPLVEHEDRFEADFAAIDNAPECKIHFLCSPNNPTGNELPGTSIADLAARVADHGLVVVDEAYVEFGDQPSLAARVGEVPNLVVLRTLSKAYGLAGCRIGAVIASTEIIGLLRRIIAPYPLPTPAVAAAMKVLAPGARKRRRRQLVTLKAEKRTLVTALDTHPAIINIWPGAANFVLVRTTSGADLVAAAARAGIRLRDQSTQPGLADCVRITIGTPEENLKLIEFLSAWQP
jgi:histidinol-phosphate aminotransferase